mmetsp:Transcript_22525/g.51910  ORF Transcript_22525/g.51910 Transcript_22525/m.51910 type:complete len:91 (-) Transcript_22525:64-336(-)
MPETIAGGSVDDSGCARKSACAPPTDEPLTRELCEGGAPLATTGSVALGVGESMGGAGVCPMAESTGAPPSTGANSSTGTGTGSRAHGVT